MSDKIYDVPAEWRKRAFVDDAKYKEMYERSIKDPNGFWAEQAKRIDWIKPFTKVKNTSYDAAQRLDQVVRGRHAQRLPTTASTVIWPSAATRPRSSGKATIRRTTRKSPTSNCTPRCCRFANVLKARGVKKGDRVTIYLPMIPEAAYAMLACARIGAVHSVVFGGFSPDSLAGRIERLQVQRGRSPPTRACAAAARFRSRPIPTPPATRPAASNPSSSCKRTGAAVEHGGRAATSITTTSPRPCRPIARARR